MYVCNLACVNLGMIFSGLLNENCFPKVLTWKKLAKVNIIQWYVGIELIRVNMNDDDKAIIGETHSLTYLSS